MMPVSQKERIVKELVEGKDYAIQLQELLKRSAESDRGTLMLDYEDIAVKILNSFSEALSLLGTAADSDSAASGCFDDRPSEDSCESRKRALSVRGSFKRKKTANSLGKVSSTIEDGHAWRKYGQKNILNAKYPRSYFRCTHKYDQGCKATKQVQRKEDDPSLYHITYIGNHTCTWNVPTSSSAPIIKEEESSHHGSLDNAIFKDFMAFHDDQTATIDDHCLELVVPSLDFETAFQFLDESQFHYL